MQKKKRNRLIGILLVMLLSLSGIYIILSSLSDNIVFFHPPSELHKINSSHDKVRVGGLVKSGSIDKISDTKISFIITDNKAELRIEYVGILPALFREGQGIVAEGFLVEPGLFRAQKLLAKHDENYRPPGNTSP